jgi:hypothetical protein
VPDGEHDQVAGEHLADQQMLAHPAEAQVRRERRPQRRVE